MAKQIPRAGMGTEIYLFPTVDVLPDAASEAFGIQADFPEPVAENKTKDAISVSGDLREGSDSKLPIRIAIEGIATIERNLERQIARAIAGNIPIHEVIKRVRGTLYPPHIGIPVPRFSVQLAADLGPRGVEPDFVDLAEFPPITAPSGYFLAEEPTYASAPALAIDQDGAVLCAYIIEKDGGGDDGKHKIACHRFDQATDSGWVSLVDEDGMDFIGTLNTPQIALVTFRREVYAIVSDAGTLGSGATGSLYVYRLEPESGSFLYVSGPTRIGTANGVIGNGGITAAVSGDRVVVAIGCYSSPQIAFREETRTIWIGQSSDLATWSDGSGSESGFVALDAFLPVLPKANDGSPTVQQVNRIRFADDARRGWAVTQSGRIYATIDGGVRWFRQDSPVGVPLHDVVVVGGVDEAIILFACGASGCLLRSLDSGTTWLIVSIARSEESNIDSSKFAVSSDDAPVDNRSRPAIGEAVLYGLATDGSNLWLVGENLILRLYELTENKVSITVQPDMTPPDTVGTYKTVALLYPESAEHPDGPTILVGGTIQRRFNRTPKDLKRYRFLRITRAKTPAYAPARPANHRYTFHDEILPESYGVESIVRRAWNEAYAVGSGGTLLLSTNLDATTPTWEPVAVPTKRNFTSMVYRQGTTAGSHELLLVTDDGLLFRSVRSGFDWVVQHIGNETIGRCVEVLTDNSEDDEQGVIVCGGGKGLWRTDLDAVKEAMPSLCPLRGGGLILATANLDQGRVDIRRSVDRGATFTRFDLSGEAVVSFADQQDEIGEIEDTTLRPSLFVDAAGQLVLTAGTQGKVSTDGRGDTWVDHDSPKLPLPLGEYPITDATTENRSRQSIGFGGGRYLSVSLLNNEIVTRLARQWVDNPAKPYCPVIPGVAQWVGVDDLRVVFDSITTPIGEAWLIPADYRFPARNLVHETRALSWRGKPNSAAVATIDWNRSSESAVFLKGKGDAWSVDAGALFGTNFRKAELHLSWIAGEAFPTDPTEYVILPMSADVERFTVANAPGSGTPNGVLITGGKAWVPSCYRAGVRQYYVEIDHGGTKTAYKIIDNTDEALLIARDSTSPAVSVGDVATVYTDRMATDGRGAIYNGAPMVAASMLPLLEFPVWVRLAIPVQPTPEGYRKIDTAIIGRHVPVVLNRPDGQHARDRFDAGWRWRSTIPAIEERAASGARAVTHLGRPVQGWALAYSGQYWWDRDATLGPMLANMRSAFALIFDDADLLTVELVHLATELPAVAHSGSDLYGMEIELVEVV